MVFHVLNRGVGRMDLFKKEGDFEAFERCIEKTLQSCPMRICAYCLLSKPVERRWLSDWPLPLPGDWKEFVNEPQSEAELDAIRRSVVRGQPYGGEAWAKKTAAELGLESTFRSRGRPKRDETPTSSECN